MDYWDCLSADCFFGNLGRSDVEPVFANTWLDCYYKTRQNPEITKHAFDFLAAWPEKTLSKIPVEIFTQDPALLILYLLPCIAIYWKRNLLYPWLWMVCTVGFVLFNGSK
jgi:hypothetical protein